MRDRSAHCLDSVVESARHLPRVDKDDVGFGDLVLVTTRNSDYAIHVLDDDSYLVWGGWFARKGRSPMRVGITGCTWGGNVIKVDALAACGLRLEFGNRVTTTPVQRIRVFRGSGLQ